MIAVLLPVAFHTAVQPSNLVTDPLTDAQEKHDILAISHGVAVILIFSTPLQFNPEDPTLIFVP